MTLVETPVATLQQLGALVTAAQQTSSGLVTDSQVLGTLDKLCCQATATPHLDNVLTVGTGAGVTLANGAGMGAALRSRLAASQLTFPAVCARRDIIRGSPHSVTLPGTLVVATP